MLAMADWKLGRSGIARERFRSALAVRAKQPLSNRQSGRFTHGVERNLNLFARREAVEEDLDHLAMEAQRLLGATEHSQRSHKKDQSKP